MTVRKSHIVLMGLAFGACAFFLQLRLRRVVVEMIQMTKGKKTVAQRVDEYGDVVRSRLLPHLRKVGIAYPPKSVVLVGLKLQKVLEVWISNDAMAFKRLRTYPILAASGTLGPKLCEGDLQVPEGLYRIESLNPNSLFHLALRLDYPNAFDRAKGQLDGRNDLGGDIMIHGGDCSVGCLAIGDEAAEDLFILAAETGIENVSVILSPVDFRTGALPADIREVPGWTNELYEDVRSELAKLAGD